jgi:hypothetical protein
MNLIICHQNGIPFDIGTKDGSELACDLLVVVGHVEITFWLRLKMIFYRKVVIRASYKIVT